ncbi:MAG: hypothetical protein WA632_10290, partial [Gallionella sp.]
ASRLILQTSRASYGLTMGLGLRWRLMEHMSAQGRLAFFSHNLLTNFYHDFGTGATTEMFQGEAVLLYYPVESVAVRGGYAVMSLTPETSTESQLIFNVRGPIMGIDFSF